MAISGYACIISIQCFAMKRMPALEYLSAASATSAPYDSYQLVACTGRHPIPLLLVSLPTNNKYRM